MGCYLWCVDNSIGLYDMTLTILIGDLIYTRILDQEVVVINSQPVAQALLEKRSRIYADRPYMATLEP